MDETWDLGKMLFYVDANYAMVTRSQENLNVKTSVENIIEEIASKLGELNKLFKNHIVRSGSTYEGTKVLNPDEFDLMFCLDDLSGDYDVAGGDNAGCLYLGGEGNVDKTVNIFEVTNCEKSPGHVKLEVLNENAKKRWSSFMLQSEGKFYLDATSVKAEFSKLLKEAIQRVNWPASLRYLYSPSNLLDVIPFKPPHELLLKWEDKMEISIDVVPCVSLKRCKSLDAYIDIKHLSELHDKNVTNVLREVLQRESLMAVGRVEMFWRMSWSGLEMSLMRHLSETVPNVLLCYRVMKYLNETHFTNDAEPIQKATIINSYPLKNILFHTWAQHINDNSAWNICALGNRVVEMFVFLARAFREISLPCFLMPQRNLFGPGTWNVPAAEAIDQLVGQLLAQNNTWSLSATEEFLQAKIQIKVPKPKKKLSDYKIRQVKPGDPLYRPSLQSKN